MSTAEQLSAKLAAVLATGEKIDRRTWAKIELELLLAQLKRQRVSRRTLNRKGGLAGLSANDRFYLKECGALPAEVAKKDRPLCRARCRDGHACRATVAAGRRRCRMHGGSSTGPRTQEGKAAIAASNRRRSLQKAQKMAEGGDASGQPVIS